jgi:hypothetical protein
VSKEAIKQLIQKQAEALGLTDVRVSPQVHLVQAKDKDDKEVVIVVDPETMVAIMISPNDAIEQMDRDQRRLSVSATL